MNAGIRNLLPMTRLYVSLMLLIETTVRSMVKISIRESLLLSILLLYLPIQIACLWLSMAITKTVMIFLRLTICLSVMKLRVYLSMQKFIKAMWLMLLQLRTYLQNLKSCIHVLPPVITRRILFLP